MQLKKITRTENIVRSVVSGLSMFVFAFLVGFVAFSGLTPVTDGSAASNISFTNNATSYYANISTLGTVNIDVDSTPSGAVGIGKDTVSVDTNIGTAGGYKLFIGMEENTTLDTNANRLYPTTDPEYTGSAYVSPLAVGTTKSNLEDTSSVNKWGYVSSRSVSTATATDIEAVYNDTESTSEEKTVFSGVPVYGDEEVFYTNNNPAAEGSNSVDVYYGINASTALPSGDYAGTVQYTAIVDMGVDDTTDASVAPSSQSGLSAGQTLTITTGLYPGFDVDNMGEITVTVGDNTCTNPTPSIEATNHNLIITCTAPAQTLPGNYTVTINVARYSKTYTLANAYEYVAGPYTVNITNTNTTSSVTSIDVPYGGSRTFTVTPASGYYLSGYTCPTGYTCTLSDGVTAIDTTTAATGTQTIMIKNNNYLGGGTISFTGTESTAWMQDFTCSSLTSTGQSTTLRDRRDNTDYLVAKLADGKCWMVQDLKLGGDSDMALTNTYSNVSSSGFTLKAENTGTWCTTNDSSCDDQSMMIKTGVPNGYLYNWYAATAGSGTYSTSSGAVSYDICPKNWRLPTGGASSEFVTLSTSYGGPSTNQGSQQTAIANLMASPIPGFNYTGYRSGGSTGSTTTNGSYWSRTASSNNGAYDLYFDSSGGLGPQGSGSKWYGSAIRCIATQ